MSVIARTYMQGANGRIVSTDQLNPLPTMRGTYTRHIIGDTAAFIPDEDAFTDPRFYQSLNVPNMPVKRVCLRKETIRPLEERLKAAGFMRE
jgi:hypothetical protein